MNSNFLIVKSQIFSSIFSIILGILLHFTFAWSNNNLLVASFSSVNESTWEHLKLIFFPMLLNTIISYFYIGKNIKNFFCAKTIGIITALLFTIIFFYTYTGILGTNFSVLNIATFFIAILLGEYISYKLLISNFSCDTKITFIILAVLFICFIVFTYITPQIGLFEDPITGQFGIPIL